MQTIEILRGVVGLAAGGSVGAFFGMIQGLAARRNLAYQQTGKLNHAWQLMPGSMTRVALLLVALALVQIICPMLFVDGTQWWVSAGVVFGYGWMLIQQMRERRRNA